MREEAVELLCACADVAVPDVCVDGVVLDDWEDDDDEVVVSEEALGALADSNKVSNI
jgi:hypothetical protein